MTAFAPGTVGYLLNLMNGVWHDHINLYDLAGKPIELDMKAGTPGASPFDNLVYIEFDGIHYKQTNVTFKGRPLHVRSFTGKLIEGVLHFDKLGPNDPGHIGVAAGYNVIAFMPQIINDSLKKYTEPDFITIFSPQQRARSTLLYRDGVPVRTLHAQGYKVAPIANRRVPSDPRGEAGDVHDDRSETQVFK